MKEPRIFPRERPTPWTRAPLPPRGRLDGGPGVNAGHPMGVNTDPFLMAAGSLGGNLAPLQGIQLLFQLHQAHWRQTQHTSLLVLVTQA